MHGCRTRPTRILLVDDHRLVREGLKVLFGREPSFRVVGEASSGREAVRLARELQPDVVVMDVAMDDTNGIVATHQIRSRMAGVRVVALSSDADPYDVAAAFAAGASAYVLKTDAHEQLGVAVGAAAAGRCYLGSAVAGTVVARARAAAQPRPRA